MCPAPTKISLHLYQSWSFEKNFIPQHSLGVPASTKIMYPDTGTEAGIPTLLPAPTFSISQRLSTCSVPAHAVLANNFVLADNFVHSKNLGCFAVLCLLALENHEL